MGYCVKWKGTVESLTLLTQLPPIGLHTSTGLEELAYTPIAPMSKLNKGLSLPGRARMQMQNDPQAKSGTSSILCLLKEDIFTFLAGSDMIVSIDRKLRLGGSQSWGPKNTGILCSQKSLRPHTLAEMDEDYKKGMEEPYSSIIACYVLQNIAKKEMA